MTRKILYISIICLSLRYGSIHKTILNVSTGIRDLSKTDQSRNIREWIKSKQNKEKEFQAAKKIYFNPNTKLTDLLDLDRISFEVPKKEKIIIQLPTISTVLTPAVKSFQNWKNNEHKSSDQSDQKDEKLIQSILRECQKKQVIEEEMIDLDDLEEFRELGEY